MKKIKVGFLIDGLKVNSYVYDLGCSLGASTKALLDSVSDKNLKVISIDNSAAMIGKCNKLFNSYVDEGRLELKLEDINTSLKSL